MVDEIVTAGININVQGISGSMKSSSNDSDKILKDILKELQKGNRESFSQNRKQSSFGGASSSFGGALPSLLRTLLDPKTLVTTGVGAAAYGISTQIDPDNKASEEDSRRIMSRYVDGSTSQYQQYDTQEGYIKGVMEDGEEVVLKVNKKTGEILDILTNREAIEQGVMDELGNIHSDFKGISKEAKDLYDKLPKVKGKVLLTEGFIADLNTKIEESKLLQDEIIQAQKRIRDKLNGDQTDNPTDIPTASPDQAKRAADKGPEAALALIDSFTMGNYESNSNNNQVLSIIKEQKASSGSAFMDIALLNGGLFK